MSSFETPPDALTIMELFSRDPLKLTKPDIRQIVAFYRHRAKLYNMGSTTAGKIAPPKVSAKAATAAEALKGTNIDLDL